MPTVTAEQIDEDKREATARVRILEVVRDSEMNRGQAIHLLASMLVDLTKRREVESPDDDETTHLTVGKEFRINALEFHWSVTTAIPVTGRGHAFCVCIRDQPAKLDQLRPLLANTIITDMKGVQWRLVSLDVGIGLGHVRAGSEIGLIVRPV